MQIERFGSLTEEARRALKPVCADLGLLSARLGAGLAELWRFRGDTWFVTRIEQRKQHPPELVVDCCVGSGLQEIIPILVAAARKQGLCGIRFHTARRGFERLLKEFRLTELERVYWHDLGGADGQPI